MQSRADRNSKAMSLSRKSTEKSPIVILGVPYRDSNRNEMRIHVSSLFRFTYRKDFPTLSPYPISSDAGWGCMLRSAQMLMACALQRHLLGRDWRKSDNINILRASTQYCNILKLFSDYPGPPHIYSIHHLVQCGMRYDKLPGEWFGPSTAALVLRDLTKLHRSKYGGSLEVLVTQGDTIYIRDCENLCSTSSSSSGISKDTSNDDNDCDVDSKDENDNSSLFDIEKKILPSFSSDGDNEIEKEKEKNINGNGIPHIDGLSISSIDVSTACPHCNGHILSPVHTIVENGSADGGGSGKANGHQNGSSNQNGNVSGNGHSSVSNSNGHSNGIEKNGVNGTAHAITSESGSGITANGNIHPSTTIIIPSDTAPVTLLSKPEADSSHLLNVLSSTTKNHTCMCSTDKRSKLVPTQSEHNNTHTTNIKKSDPSPSSASSSSSKIKNTPHPPIFDPLLNPPPSYTAPWQCSLVVCIPLRLGISAVSQEYIEELKELLRHPNSLGFVGGRMNHAIYFTGYKVNSSNGNTELLGLDPHSVYAANKDDPFPSADLVSQVHVQDLDPLDSSRLDPSLALALYFRDREEFEMFCEETRSTNEKKRLLGINPLYCIQHSAPSFGSYGWSGDEQGEDEDGEDCEEDEYILV